MKFLTDAWFAEFKAQLLDVFSAGKTPTKITLTLCEQYSAVPQLDNKDAWLFYAFNNGVLNDVSYGIGLDTSPAADYTSYADYDISMKVILGELGAARAIMSGKAKLKGNVTKALKMLDTYNRIQGVKGLGGKTEW